MEPKNKLTDCIKKIVFCDFDLTILTLKDYYADAYYDNSENIFEVQKDEDFKALIDIYGLTFAVMLYKNCRGGYVIGGMNIPAERVVLIDAENYKGVFEKFSDLIGERILKLYEGGSSLTEIERVYCTIDVKKFLFGYAYKVTKTTFKGDNKIAEVVLTNEDGDTFEKSFDCEVAILIDITQETAMFDAQDDFHYEVNKYGHRVEFINHTNNITIRYEFKDTERK